MKILKIFGIGIVGLIALVIVISFFLPKSYHVERTVSIGAPAAQVHRLTSDLQDGWPQWEPFSKADESVQTTYGAITSGVGASQAWTSDSGNGELTFTACDVSNGVEYDMAFNVDQYLSTASLTYNTTATGTDVTWAMDGEVSGIVGKYFGVLMDGMVGPMFETGLNDLKTAAEALPSLEAAPAEILEEVVETEAG